MYRFTVVRLQPNSAAIRFVPQPLSCSRTIAETSSGISMTSPREAKSRGDPCPFPNIPLNPPPFVRGPLLHVVRGPVFHVARYPRGAFRAIVLLEGGAGIGGQVLHLAGPEIPFHHVEYPVDIRFVILL